MAKESTSTGLWGYFTQPRHSVFILPNAWDCKQIVAWTLAGVELASQKSLISGGETIFSNQVWAKCGGDLSSHFNRKKFKGGSVGGIIKPCDKKEQEEKNEKADLVIETMCHQDDTWFGGYGLPYLKWTINRDKTLPKYVEEYRFAQTRKEELEALTYVKNRVSDLTWCDDIRDKRLDHTASAANPPEGKN